MKNHSDDLDLLTTEIETAINLLYCFDDFCENEGNFESCKSYEDQKLAVISFAERTKFYRSLLFAAERTLDRVAHSLNQIINDMLGGKSNG